MLTCYNSGLRKKIFEILGIHLLNEFKCKNEAENVEPHANTDEKQDHLVGRNLAERVGGSTGKHM